MKDNKSFWDKVSLGIGYEGGICYTGDDLKPLSSSGLELIIPFYWSNSIKSSVYYPICEEGEEFGVSIDFGVEYVRLNNRDNSFSNAYWDFRTIYGAISFNYNFMRLGLIGQISWSKDVEKIYEDTDNDPYTPDEIVGREFYYGDGRGYGVFYNLEKKLKQWIIGVKFTFTGIRYTGSGPYYPIKLNTSGIHFFIQWRIK